MDSNLDKGFFHVLKQGEDVWLLAELYYGNYSLWWIIYHANIDALGDDPETSPPGLELYIPYLEAAEEHDKVPDFIAQVAFDPSRDPVVLVSDERYGDVFLCFDLYEFNRWEPYNVPLAGEDIAYFARSNKPDMRRAERWRSIFYRG